MATITEKLTQLESDRQDFVDNLETKGITGLSGDETFTELVPEVLNISGGGGADLTDYFYEYPYSIQAESFADLIKKTPPINCAYVTSLEHFFENFHYLEDVSLTGMEDVQSMSYAFAYCDSLQTVSINDSEGISDWSYCFTDCLELITAPTLETAGGSDFTYMFGGCLDLTNVPVYHLDAATVLSDMFKDCSNLSNTALDNILQSCMTVQIYQGAKSLYELGITDDYYLDDDIKELPHYNDFVAAGWEIGF